MKSDLLFRTFYNTSAQVLGRLSSGFLAFLTTVILAQLLGAAQFGEYTKALTYLAFFYILVDFGLNAIFLRDFGARLASTLSPFVGLRLFGSAFLALVAFFLMMMVSYTVPGWSGVLGAVGIGSVSIVGFGLFLTVSAAFQMQKRYMEIAISQTVGAGVALGSLFFLPRPLGVQAAMVSVVAGWWGSAAVSFFLLQRPLAGFPIIDLSMWRRICWASLPLGITLVLNTIYFRADTFILATFRSSAEVGAYGLAYKFFEVALIVPTFVMNSLYPELLGSQLNLLELRRKFSTIWKTFLLISVVVAMGMWILAPLLVLVKTDFADSVLYLRILSLSLPFFYLTSPLMWFYILLKQQRKLIWVYGLSLIFNVLGNALFVPKYGASAAAWVTGLTEVVVLCIGMYFIQRKNEHVYQP